MNGIEPTPEKREGNYLIGNTTFNPFTNEKFYWIKVGTARNIKSRMGNYNTHTPTTYVIEFDYCGSKRWEKEEFYHIILMELFEIPDTENRKRTSVEWFRVTEEDYLNICKYGFKYLDNKYNEINEKMLNW